MSTKEILQEINKLPVSKRVRILHKLKQDLKSQSDAKIDHAVAILRADYLNDRELIAFTALDSEKIYGSS